MSNPVLVSITPWRKRGLIFLRVTIISATDIHKLEIYICYTIFSIINFYVVNGELIIYFLAVIHILLKLYKTRLILLPLLLQI